MNYTQNYQLPQWEKTDRIMMDDFNDAMSVIEEGLSAKCELYFGSYAGTGQYGPENPNTLTFDFAPRVVILFGYATNPGDHMVMIRPYEAARSYDGNYTSCAITWLENGVRWYNGFYDLTQFNRLNQTYYYIAVK